MVENEDSKEYDIYIPQRETITQDEDIIESTLETESIYKQYKLLQEKSRIREQKFTLDDIQGLDNEEKQYFIINRDNGEVFDIRNGEVIQNLFKNLENMNLKIDFNKEKFIWKDFWEQYQKIHEDLISSAIYGDFDRIKEIIQEQGKSYPIDINFKEFDDMTAVHYCAQEGHIECAKLLIHANANLEALTKFKRTPLHLCILRDNVEFTLLLIEKGCNINCQDKEFNTPLHLATENGLIEIIDLLLNKSANTEIKNYQGVRPFEITHNENILEIYRKYNIQTEIKDFSYNLQRKDFIDKILSPKKSTSARNSTIFFNKVIQSKRNEVKILQKITQDDFDFYKVLGKGAFGQVYLVKRKYSQECKDDEFYAMKMLDKERIKTNNLVKYARVEKNVMKVMDHPFIVQLKYTFQTNNGLFLVMKFCSGGDLKQLLDKYSRLDEYTARIYICEILLAIEALHRQNIIFRDLKPANILIDEQGHALLADFGLANQKINDDELSKSFCGTPAYLAPEMVKKMGHNRTLDWYLLGVLLYECLTGVTPYYARDKAELYNQILTGVLKMPKNIISKNASDLIIKLLNRNPLKRLGYERDAEEIKEHPFFSEIDWDDIQNRKYIPNVNPDWCKIPQQPSDIKIPQISNDIILIEDWSFAEQEQERQRKGVKLIQILKQQQQQQQQTKK